MQHRTAEFRELRLCVHCGVVTETHHGPGRPGAPLEVHHFLQQQRSTQRLQPWSCNKVFSKYMPHMHILHIRMLLPRLLLPLLRQQPPVSQCQASLPCAHMLEQHMRCCGLTTGDHPLSSQHNTAGIQAMHCKHGNCKLPLSMH
jgi:hypothetical protein